MSTRPILRAVVAIALLLLAAVAAVRLPLSYTPRTTFPLITVTLLLGESTDVTEMTQRWLQPIESEVRSLGGIRGTRGRVSGQGGWLQVLLQPGIDPERKAARLTSNLTRLRGRLPAASALLVRPSTGSSDEQVSLLWLTAADVRAASRAVADDLRDLPGVRDVVVYGAAGEELRVRLGGASPVGPEVAVAVREAIRRSLLVNRVGSVSSAGRLLPVLTTKRDADDLATLPVRAGSVAMPLDAMASLTSRPEESPWRARFDGRAGVALAVFKDSSASLLGVDRAVRRRIAAITRGGTVDCRVEVIESQADDLWALLVHLGFGLALAAAGLAGLGLLAAGRSVGARLALAPILALAAALNAFGFAGISLNLLTLLGLAAALAAVVPLAAVRVLARVHHSASATISCVLAAAALPIAVHLGGARLSPALAEPARALFFAVAAAAPTIFILLPRASRASRTRWVGLRQRALLRQPLSVLLVAATTVLALFAAFGSKLELTGTPLQQDPQRLSLDVRLPEGTTLDDTSRFVREVETRLAGLDEVQSTWSVFRPAHGTIELELDRASRRADRRRRLTTRLRYLLPDGVVSIQPAYRAATSGTAGGFALADELEEHATTDEQALLYGVVLRSADLRLLRRAYERLRARAVALGFPGSGIRPGWGAPTVQRVLVPRPGVTPQDLVALAGTLRRRSELAPGWALPGPEPRVLRVVDADAPASAEAIPRVADLLAAPALVGGAPVTPAARVEVEEQLIFQDVDRESGRFVLPVEIAIPGFVAEVRREKREKLDRHLSRMPLPSGVDLERPELKPAPWAGRRLQMIALAAMLPLLLAAIATFHMNSATAGVGALLPGVLGLACVTPQLRLAGGRLDELTLFMLAAATCGSLPVALSVLGAAARRLSRAAPSATVYRVLRDGWPALVGGALGSALMLGTAGVLADATRQVWARPLRVAATAATAAHLASLLVLPALALSVLTWVRRDPEQVRRSRRPPTWIEPTTPPVIVARSLTKIYSGGLRALNDVSFEIGPGIVGLLGPNGAGKTTLIRLMTGLQGPTRGSLTYRGIRVMPDNLPTFRRDIGFLPQEFNTYATVTARQFLEYWSLERTASSSLGRAAEIERVLDVVGLLDEADRRIRDYSGGMRRRIGIALALLGDPSVLIVDEPTTGLDLESRIRFRETLLRVAGEKIIVFSTHIPSDVDAVAARLLLLHRGRLRFDGRPSELIRAAEGRVFDVVLDDGEMREFSRRYRISTRVRTVEGIRVRAVATPDQPTPGNVVRPTLEEAYLAEIDVADREAGIPRRTTLFSFLQR